MAIGANLPRISAGALGLGVERLVVARAAVHPDQDAARRPARPPAAAASPRSRRASTRPPPIRAPRPSRRQSRRVVDSQFVRCPSGSRSSRHGRSVGSGQSLKTNSAEFSKAQSRSSTAARRSTPGSAKSASADVALLVGREPAVGAAGTAPRRSPPAARRRRRAARRGPSSPVTLRVQVGGVHQVERLDDRRVGRPLARGVLVRVGPAEGVEEERGGAVRPDRRGAACRAGAASKLSGTPGHVGDRVEQDLGPEPLAVVPGEVPRVGDVPLVRLGAEAVDATRP